MIIKNRVEKQFLDRKKDDMEGNNVLFELKSTDFKLNQLKATKKKKKLHLGRECNVELFFFLITFKSIKFLPVPLFTSHLLQEHYQSD